MSLLWNRLIALYGKQWEINYGSVGDDTYLVWHEALKQFTPDQVSRGYQRLVQEGVDFVPNLIKFLRLCRTPEAYSEHKRAPELPKPKPRYSVRRIEVLKMQFLFTMPIEIPKLKDEHMIVDWTEKDEALLLDAMAQFTPNSSLEEVNAVIDYIQFSGGRQRDNAYSGE